MKRIFGYSAVVVVNCALILATMMAMKGVLLAGVGATGAQFLKISPSARASAMGDAAGAISDDVFAIFTNPAGLAALEKAELGATYISYFADVNYGFIGYTDPATRAGAVGFGLTYLIADKFEKRLLTEEKIGEFNAKDMALSVSYAKKDAAPSVLEALDVGGTLRLISSEIDQVTAYTVALDAGAIYRANESLSVGVALQNISPGLKFKEVTDNLPLNLKLAGAYKFSPKVKAALDINEYIIDSKFYASCGAEYTPLENLAIRLGYKYGYDTASLGSIVGITGGVGFSMWGAALDYAFVPFGDLGDTHRVSLSLKF